MTRINEQVKDAFRKLNEEVIRPRVLAEKTREYAKARKADLYFRGQQYLSSVSDGWNTIDYVPIEDDIKYRGEETPFVRDYVINNYRALARKFCSVLGGKAPSLKAVPLRDDDDQSLRLSKQCDLLALDFHRRWERDDKHMDLALLLFKYGTSWIYTPYHLDRQKYGETTVTEIQQQESVTQTAEGPLTEMLDVPVPRTFTNGYVECHILSGLEATCPGGIKDISKAPWFVYEREEYVGTILTDHPEWRDTVLRVAGQNGLLDTSLEGRNLRGQVGSPLLQDFYDGVRDRITISDIWYVPGTMMQIEGDEIRDVVNGQVIEQPMYQHLLGKYPRGAKATFIGDEMVDLVEESLADVLTPCKPEISDTLECDGVGYDYLGVQDIINDAANIIIETLERGPSLLIVDPSVINVDALEGKPSAPGSFVRSLPGAGGMLDKAIREVGGLTVDPQLFQIAESFHQTGSDIIGIRPEIYGGGEGVQTAEEARIKATQALRQLGVTWKQMRQAWQQAAWKAVQQFARFHPDVIEIAGEVINPEDLMNAPIRFEAQESMPQTFGELRDAIRDWVNLGPESWQVFGVSDPRNATLLEQYLSIPGWKFPRADEIAKLEAVLSQLKEEDPQQDPMTGQMGPSQQPEPGVDDPQLAVDMVRLWAASPSGMRVKRTKPAGYENVMLWKSAYDMALQQQQMAAQMQQGGAPPPPGGGPPPPNEGQPTSPEMGALEPMPMPPPVDPFAADPNTMPLPPELSMEQVMPASPMAEELMR